MKSLFLVISILCVLPSIYQALSVPQQNTLPLRGVSHRQKRAENDTVTCEVHQYKPRKKNYCCDKCHAGRKVKKDCQGEGQATVCEPCDTNSFTNVPNGAKNCERCSSCLAQVGQIVVSNCTRVMDTQCGCPDGYFIKRERSTFTCEECSQCHNGTIAAQCKEEQNTVCTCYHNFFSHSADGTCRPCDKCDDTRCKELCPSTGTVVKPEENKEGLLWLAVAAAIGSVVIAVAGIGGVYYYYRRRAISSSSRITGSSTQIDPLISNNDEFPNKTKNSHLPGHPKPVMIAEDNPYIREHCVHTMQQCSEDNHNLSFPLPDITNTTASPCIESLKVKYAIIESVPVRQWREFARRLGLSDHTIDTSERNHTQSYKDSQYEMLKEWINKDGSSTAKRDQLFNVLREMHLGGCIEKIEEHLFPQ